MKRALASIGLLLIGLLPVVAVGAQQSADAVAGCHGKVRTLLNGRSQDSWFNEPFTGNKVPYRVTARPVYWYCPNGASAWKLQDRAIEWCWSQNGRETNHKQWDGITANARIINDRGIVSNPGPIKIPDDGTRQNCRLQDFSADMSDWSYGFLRPRWAGGWTANLAFMNDQHHEFGEFSTNGPTYQRFRPRHDPVLKDWWS